MATSLDNYTTLLCKMDRNGEADELEDGAGAIWVKAW